MVHIVDKFYFLADEVQYILYEKGEREKIDIKTKKPTGIIAPYTITLGYYSTIEIMLKALSRKILRDKIHNDEITTWKETVQAVQDLYEQEKELLSSLHSL